ncbi:YpdA family putative bacillithiol disulfide reductase [Pedobacter sp. HMF7647]|uniref:YpdA family putative bacillithiol disulfide reductase n=1 Tax=Hufsiella arboris TaxID=2695275 RepID=A0A7K1Y9I1_9SPHI|nr:YpdA family putative bacillithiol disulfide reductase [Hufsiella arboris]MXV51246.1 YpdA family putative bacillithiol disulfide reductase [Hufsiella arboris]
MENQFDLVIIGGGPIGLACGIEAKKAGLSYVILEKGALVNSIFNYPVNMTFFSTSERLEIGKVPFVSNNPKPTRSEAMEYYRRVTTTFNLNIKLYEKVQTVTKVDDEFSVHTSKNEYLTKNIILAIGFYDLPNKMDVPGEDLQKVSHYYDDPHKYAFQKVLVVGANNSSVDAALETFRKGSEVTMVIRKDEIGRRVKYWVKPDIENRIKEGSIKAFFNSSLAAIREKEVDIMTPEGAITIPNDYVLALTGYQPNFSFLKKIGLTLSDDEKLIPVHNETTMETAVPGIYLAGVVCGGMETHVWFIENSREHAYKIVDAIKEKMLNQSGAVLR